MKLNCGLSREAKLAKARIEAESEAIELSKWHQWFAWFPVRIAERDCRVLETVERRYIDVEVALDYNFPFINTWKIIYNRIEYRKI